MPSFGKQTETYLEFDRYEARIFIIGRQVNVESVSSRLNPTFTYGLISNWTTINQITILNVAFGRN